MFFFVALRPFPSQKIKSFDSNKPDTYKEYVTHIKTFLKGLCSILKIRMFKNLCVKCRGWKGLVVQFILMWIQQKPRGFSKKLWIQQQQKGFFNTVGSDLLGNFMCDDSTPNSCFETNVTVTLTLCKLLIDVHQNASY